MSEVSADSFVQSTGKLAQCTLLVGDPPECFRNSPLASLFQGGYRRQGGFFDIVKYTVKSRLRSHFGGLVGKF